MTLSSYFELIVFLNYKKIVILQKKHSHHTLLHFKFIILT